MIKSRKVAFTVVELMVIIAVIAILTAITTIAYRETQKNSRNEKRKVDAVMLRSAVEDYYADKGDYPRPSSCTSECQNNEVWELLKSEGYLNRVPQPETKSYSPSHNKAPDGNANYIWVYNSANPAGYGIYVPAEGTSCKTGKNMREIWWNNALECQF